MWCEWTTPTACGKGLIIKEIAQSVHQETLNPSHVGQALFKSTYGSTCTLSSHGLGNWIKIHSPSMYPNLRAQNEPSIQNLMPCVWCKLVCVVPEPESPAVCCQYYTMQPSFHHHVDAHIVSTAECETTLIHCVWRLPSMGIARVQQGCTCRLQHAIRKLNGVAGETNLDLLSCWAFCSYPSLRPWPEKRTSVTAVVLPNLPQMLGISAAVGETSTWCLYLMVSLRLLHVTLHVSEPHKGFFLTLSRNIGNWS